MQKCGICVFVLERQQPSIDFRQLNPCEQCSTNRDCCARAAFQNRVASKIYPKWHIACHNHGKVIVHFSANSWCKNCLICSLLSLAQSNDIVPVYLTLLIVPVIRCIVIFLFFIFAHSFWQFCLSFISQHLHKSSASAFYVNFNEHLSKIEMNKKR